MELYAQLLNAVSSIVLTLSLGYLLLRCVIGFSSQSALTFFVACLPAGVAGISLLGALFFALSSMPWAAVCLVALLFGIVIFRRTHSAEDEGGWRARSLVLAALLSVAVTGAFVSYTFAHFNQRGIVRGMDPWALTDRLKLYHVPDHYLQFIVSQSLFLQRDIETGFNPDGKQLWSAGDRPILAGLYDASISLLFGEHRFNLYFFRVVFLGSFFIFPLVGLLTQEFKMRSALGVALFVAYILFHPFFFSNVLFTWPKMAGVMFTLSGFLVLSEVRALAALKLTRVQLIVAALCFVCAVLSHAASVVGVALIILYFFLTRCNVILHELSSARLKWLKTVLPGLLLFIVLTQLHSRYLAAATHQTNLLARVQICKNGSYAYPTPAISLAQACSEYLERDGWSGIIDDRVHSLERAFVRFYAEAFERLQSITVQGDLVQLLRDWNQGITFIPLYAYGVFTVPVFLLCFALNGFLRRSGVRWGSRENALFISSILALFGFGCLQALESEMMPLVIPYHITLLLQVGLLLALWRLHWGVFGVYVLVGTAVSLAMILFRATEVFRYRGEHWAISAALLFVLALLLVGALARLEIKKLELRAGAC